MFMNINSIIYLLILFRFIVSINPSMHYGEFSLRVKNIEICKGPKRRDCCNISARMEDEVNLWYDIDIKEDVIPTRGKILATANGKPLIRLLMKKPCDHLFIRPLFQSIFKASQDCTFSKGHYHFDVDIDNVAQKYYGGMFLYGNITFKSIFYSEKCNFSCTVVAVELLPKRNNTLT